MEEHKGNIPTDGENPVRKRKKPATKPKPDAAEKQFWRNKARFADIFNAFLFGGKQVIDPELLVEQNTDVSASIPCGAIQELYEYVDKREDVTMLYNGRILFILGIENQMAVHYAMPLKNRTYDDLDMMKQCNVITGGLKADGKLNVRSSFLSGIRKEDRLYPVFRIVIYYGEQPWDGPTKLSEMCDIPEELRPYFQDYEFPLFEVNSPANKELIYNNKSVRDMVTYLQMFYSKNLDEAKDSDVMIDHDTADVLASVTGSRVLRRIIGQTKGEVSMSKAVMEYEEELMRKGKSEGKEEGADMLGKLIQILLKKGDIEAVNVVSCDAEMRKEYFKKYNIG